MTKSAGELCMRPVFWGDPPEHDCWPVAVRPCPLEERTRFFERQTREARVQRARITVPEVAEEIRLDVPFRKELLIAAEARLAGGKELLVHLRLIEPRHGPAIETKRSRGHDQVRTLKARIPLRCRLHHLR